MKTSDQQCKYCKQNKNFRTVSLQNLLPFVFWTMRRLTLQEKSEIIEDCKKTDFIKKNVLKKYGITENKLTGILRNQKLTNPLKTAIHRAIGRSENPGVPVLFGGHNLPHLVEIGLTELPKSGGGAWHPRHPRGRHP